MNPYVSIDIETTGLDPSYCQVLEFGAVLENWEDPVDELPSMRVIVDPVKHYGCIIGDAGGLAMNAGLLQEIDEFGGANPSKLHAIFNDWLQEQGVAEFCPAGKNFDKFDRVFLDKLPNWKRVRMGYRSLDPGILYWWPEVDVAPPSLSTCCVRAGIDNFVAHRAVEDARKVVELIRSKFRKEYGQ
jgi:hypothetical protein